MELKNCYLTIILALHSLIIAQGNTLPVPYKYIKVLPLDLHGWMASENKTKLTYFITIYHPKVIVELGSWLGLSTIHMASTMDDNGIVYAIDNWTAQGDTLLLSDNQATSRLATLYQQFLSNVIHHNLAHKIIPIRMDTIEAAKALNITADLIYIDACHKEESVFQDIMNWYPKLSPNGIMCGDDWLSWAAEIQKGVQKAATLLKRQVSTIGNFWYFEPQ